MSSHRVLVHMWQVCMLFGVLVVLDSLWLSYTGCHGSIYAVSNVEYQGLRILLFKRGIPVRLGTLQDGSITVLVSRRCMLFCPVKRHWLILAR